MEDEGGLDLDPGTIFMTGAGLTVSSRSGTLAPGLEVIHEASSVMSEMVTSSLVGVEHAFLFLVFHEWYT